MAEQPLVMEPVKRRRGSRKEALRIRFAAWLINPRRTPRTQEEFAKEIDVAESTLSEWRRHPEVLAVLEGWREAYKGHFAEVVEAMFRKARAGDVAAARLISDWYGHSMPQRIDMTTTRVGYVEEDALYERGSKVLQGLEVLEGGRADEPKAEASAQ